MIYTDSFHGIHGTLHCSKLTLHICSLSLSVGNQPRMEQHYVSLLPIKQARAVSAAGEGGDVPRAVRAGEGTAGRRGCVWRSGASDGGGV